MELVWPGIRQLPSYVAALERGWSPNTLDPDGGRVELRAIEQDPATFLARLVDRDATGAPVRLPDGTLAARIPGYRKWIWDGELCGSIGLRWQPGTTVLPPHVLGHIGYSVVPWKRRRGYATRALQLMLIEASAEGLPHVELTTNVTNLASQRVIEANGGDLVERFAKPSSHGGTPTLRYRIALPSTSTSD